MSLADFNNFQIGYNERHENQMRETMTNAVYSGYFAGGYFNDPKKIGQPHKIIDKMFQKHDTKPMTSDEYSSVNMSIHDFNKRVGISK